MQMFLNVPKISQVVSIKYNLSVLATCHVKVISFSSEFFWRVLYNKRLICSHDCFSECFANRSDDSGEGDFCQFPFVFKNQTYRACTYDYNELLDNIPLRNEFEGPLPWCPLETGEESRGGPHRLVTNKIIFDLRVDSFCPTLPDWGFTNIVAFNSCQLEHLVIKSENTCSISSRGRVICNGLKGHNFEPGLFSLRLSFIFIILWSLECP